MSFPDDRDPILPPAANSNDGAHTDTELVDLDLFDPDAASLDDVIDLNDRRATVYVLRALPRPGLPPS